MVRHKSYDYELIQKEIDEFFATYKDLKDKFGISSGALHKAVKKGLIKFPSSTESFRRRFNSGKVKKSPLSEEHRKKVSDGMKKAHAEGRAHNIGQSRWNNTSSYPEKFFMKVVANHFEDKDYQHELPFSKYSLDFAWPHKKRVIEIDGDRHQRFEDYRERDRQKDELLKSEGWEVLRLEWREFFHNAKDYIQIAVDFIDNAGLIRDLDSQIVVLRGKTRLSRGLKQCKREECDNWTESRSAMYCSKECRSHSYKGRPKFVNNTLECFNTNCSNKVPASSHKYCGDSCKYEDKGWVDKVSECSLPDCSNPVFRKNQKYCSPECFKKSSRKVPRPSKEELQKLIVDKTP